MSTLICILFNLLLILFSYHHYPKNDVFLLQITDCNSSNRGIKKKSKESITALSAKLTISTTTSTAREIFQKILKFLYIISLSPSITYLNEKKKFQVGVSAWSIWRGMSNTYILLSMSTIRRVSINQFKKSFGPGC